MVVEEESKLAYSDGREEITNLMKFFIISTWDSVFNILLSALKLEWWNGTGKTMFK